MATRLYHIAVLHTFALVTVSSHLEHHDLERDEATAICAGVIVIGTDRLGGVKEGAGRNKQGQLCGDEA